MAFDGAIKKAKELNKAPIKLVTDPDMHMMFERGIRGGVYVISHRYAKANNPHLEGYNPSKPNRTSCTWMQIIYMDGR